MFVSIFWLPTL